MSFANNLDNGGSSYSDRHQRRSRSPIRDPENIQPGGLSAEGVLEITCNLETTRSFRAVTFDRQTHEKSQELIYPISQKIGRRISAYYFSDNKVN